jgi:methylated-DNA-[protein]-cysteine S-methyltransferase
LSLSSKIIPSPIGRLRLIAGDEGLTAILWDNDRPLPVHLSDLVENPEHPTLLCAEQELNEYFCRKRKTFSVALDMRGTHFQKQVWGALLAIPFGETRSYAQIANQVGNPKAMRAVGAANGQNPIPIMILSPVTATPPAVQGEPLPSQRMPFLNTTSKFGSRAQEVEPKVIATINKMMRVGESIVPQSDRNVSEVPIELLGWLQPAFVDGCIGGG